MGSLIKLGPPEILKAFEVFYVKALSNIDFHSIYQKIGKRGSEDYLGFVVSAPAYPPLYILSQRQGPSLSVLIECARAHQKIRLAEM